LSTLWAITDKGRALTVDVGAVAEVTGRSRGSALQEIVALDKGESVRMLVAVGGADGAPPVLLVTTQGTMKRLSVDEIAGTVSGRSVIKLKPGDSVAAAFPAPDGIGVAVVSSDAQVLHCDADGVPVQGRGAGGVAGMKLSAGATVVGAGPVDATSGDDTIVLTVTDAQTAKVTDIDEFPVRNRATGGLRATKFRGAEHRIDWAYVGPEAGLLLVVGTAEAPTRPDASPEPLTVPRTGRDLASKKTKRRLLGSGFGRW
jgi:DNA gyrase subunit A